MPNAAERIICRIEGCRTSCRVCSIPYILFSVHKEYSRLVISVVSGPADHNYLDHIESVSHIIMVTKRLTMASAHHNLSLQTTQCHAYASYPVSENMVQKADKREL